ncbi:PadR family transcriptional regulator [Luteimonas suaedae]|uniref:PadR family transcriptional regulator n=1 Tax=Luteimonas suaedae TaxID=2605430 RepID=UPI001CA9D9D2|nr:PadR family transcriptional regulator [Luteimonas suaedae]
MYNAGMPSTAESPRRASRSTPDYTDRAYWQGSIKMSLSKFFVLRVLHRQPMHGYEVVQAVAKTTRGCCSPTEGTIYPMLADFESDGCLRSHLETVQGRERKVYALTERGRDAFRTAVAAWLEATDCILASKAAAAPRRSEQDGCC